MAIDTDDLPYDPNRIYDEGLVEWTQSAIGTYQTCRMKYVLAYLLRLRGSGISVPLLVGSAVHECFDYLLDPKHDKISFNDKVEWCRKTIHRMFDVASETLDLGTVTNPEKLEHGRCQALAVVQAWMVVNGDWRERFHVVQTEQIVRAPRDTKGKLLASKGDPLEKRMAGKIDGIVIDYTEWSVYILEHKTKFTLKDINWMLGLDLNQQALFYATLYRVWLGTQSTTQITVKRKKINLGQPSGLYYDAIAKPYHRSGNTQEELIQRMATAMVEDQTKYFSFTPISITPETVQHALNNFNRIVKEADQLEGDTVTFNWNACDMYGGCPYRSICKTRPDPTEPGHILDLPEAQMFQVADLHNELELEATEEEPF